MYQKEFGIRWGGEILTKKQVETRYISDNYIRSSNQVLYSENVCHVNKLSINQIHSSSVSLSTIINKILHFTNIMTYFKLGPSLTLKTGKHFDLYHSTK